VSLATATLGTPPAPSARLDAPRQYLTFALEGRPYAVPLVQVAEITPNHPLRRIPHMPKGVAGLLDLRGQVFPVVNLSARLGLPGGDVTPENIIILDLSGTRMGILVDRVLSVLTATPEQHVAASPLLAGQEGAWVTGFVLLDGQVVVVLDSEAVTASGSARLRAGTSAATNLDRQLDESLRQLIEMAPPKEVTEADRSRVIPQIETAIGHTEEETAKVLAAIETMLAGTDRAFQGIIRLKQEAQLGHLKDMEAQIAEVERIGQHLQDQVFAAISMMQFQDIARQKLERVLKHIQGMQSLVGSRFRDQGKPS
jgi:purine-binding chemotaxis protein CheW